jgi:hypothetical protein
MFHTIARIIKVLFTTNFVATLHQQVILWLSKYVSQHVQGKLSLQLKNRVLNRARRQGRRARRLSAKHFPLVIDSPGVYVLTENVVLERTATDRSGFPTGEFAAVTIKASNVVLDLNGFSISQSEEHASCHRFFSIVELASWPFPKDNGGQFAPKRPVLSAHNCIVRNGTIGHASHFGIHGNNNTDVLLENLRIRDFEVAGISLNFAQRVVIANSKVGPSAQNVLVNQHFTHTLVPFLMRPKKCPGITHAVTKTLDEIHRHGFCTASRYANTDGLPEGNLAGIQITSFGIAVKAFQQKQQKDHSDMIFLENVTVSGLHARVLEVPRLVRHNGKPLVGLVDDSCCVKCLKSNDPYYEFLVDKSKCPAKPNISKRDTIYGMDIMNHVNKGVYAIRLDGVSRFSLDVSISNIENIGEQSERPRKVEDAGVGTKRNIYAGADSRGIVLSHCWNGTVNAQVNKVMSKHGSADGVLIQNGSGQIQGEVSVSNLKSAAGNSNLAVSQSTCVAVKEVSRRRRKHS